MSSPVRIAMIGTGWVAPQHLDAFVQVPGLQLVAVAGRDASKAQALATPRGARSFGDWRTMLSEVGPDAVYICLPPAVAVEVARGCAGRVGAVMVEKPVAADVAEAERTAQAFADAGTLAAAAYHNRVRAVVGHIAGLCAEAAPVVADAWWHGDMPGPTWWRTRAQSGGQMTEQCTHLVDLLRQWIGEAVEVTAVAARGTMAREVAGFDVDDALAATIRFASGAIATVHTSCIARPGQAADGVGLVLRARGWEAHLGGWGLDARIRRDGNEEVMASEPDVFRLQAERFRAAIAARDPAQLPCRFEDAVATLRLTRAIDTAAATGRPQLVQASR